MKNLACLLCLVLASTAFDADADVPSVDLSAPGLSIARRDAGRRRTRGMALTIHAAVDLAVASSTWLAMLGLDQSCSAQPRCQNGSLLVTLPIASIFSFSAVLLGSIGIPMWVGGARELRRPRYSVDVRPTATGFSVTF